MQSGPHEPKKLKRLRTMARCIGLNFWLGLLAVVMSFFEHSFAWTYFVCLTAWIGIVLGITGGPGYANYLLGRLEPTERPSPFVTLLLSLGTFWIPTLATAIFGLALAGGLKEGLQPASHLNDISGSMIIQSLAMYFISAGATWSIVGVEVNKELAKLESAAMGPMPAES